MSKDKIEVLIQPAKESYEAFKVAAQSCIFGNGDVARAAEEWLKAGYKAAPPHQSHPTLVAHVDAWGAQQREVGQQEGIAYTKPSLKRNIEAAQRLLLRAEKAEALVSHLPEKMTPEMREAMWEGITKHGLSNLEYWIEELYNDIRRAAIAQKEKS